MRFVYAAFASVMTLIVLAFISKTAEAHTYLAVSSGTFSSATTWGEHMPVHLAAGDEIIIPSGITVVMDCSVNVEGRLTLDGGVLSLNGHTLKFGSSSDLIVSNNGAISSTPESKITIASVKGFSGNLTFTPGSKIGDMTINTASAEGIYLGSDIIITGMLTLQSGMFYINNHELYFAGNGNFASTGSGMLSSTSVSDIGIFTNSSLGSPLRFSRQGNTVRNFTVNFANGSDVLHVDANLYVTGALVLASGRLDMGEQKLTMMRRGAMLANPDSYTANRTTGKNAKSRDARRNAGYVTANSAR